MLANAPKILIGIILLGGAIMMGELNWISFFLGCFGLIGILGGLAKLIEAFNRSQQEKPQSPS